MELTKLRISSMKQISVFSLTIMIACNMHACGYAQLDGAAADAPATEQSLLLEEPQTAEALFDTMRRMHLRRFGRL